MYQIIVSTQFKRDVKKCKRQQKDFDKFKAIAKLLENGKTLPLKNKDHTLTGNWNGHRECHIEPDWLLIYKINEDDKLIELIRMGSHAILFKS